VATRSAKSLDVRDRHSADPDIAQPFFHFFQTVRLDDGLDLLHALHDCKGKTKS
jgi:hypothetical protein